MIKSLLKAGILYLSDGRNLVASAFRCYPAPARMVGGFASSYEVKAPFVRENLSWSELNGPLPLLDIIQLQRLESPVISLSRMKQKRFKVESLKCPAILSEPPLLDVIQLQRLEWSVASRLPVRQKRLYVRSSILLPF